MTTDTVNDEALALAKTQGQLAYLRDRISYFEDLVRIIRLAKSRAEEELRSTKIDLDRANVLADRYRDLMCTIVSLAEGQEDLPIEIALVVQEAQSVVRCTEPS